MSMFPNAGAGGAMFGQVKERLQGAGGLGEMLPGLLGAGALGGIAGVLLSGKGMKDVAEGALKVGGGVAAGALAWNLYKKWSARRGSADNAAAPGAAVSTQPAVTAGPEPDGTLFIEALIFAARADGHIDDVEQTRINSLVAEMYPGRGVDAIIYSLLNRPIDPKALAAKVKSREEGQAVYKLSCLVMDVDHFMERAYLNALAECLDIEQAARELLERETDAARCELLASANK